MEDRFQISNFRVVKNLGRSKLSKVVLASDAHTHTFYAVKIIKNIDRPSLSRKHNTGYRQIENEIEVMRLTSRYNHPNLLHLFDISNPSNSAKFYLFLEYCGKGHINYAAFNQSIESMLSYTRQTLQGLDFLSMLGIVHRDIKPSNLLITDNDYVKISDFGISYILTGDDAADQLELSNTLGTPLFLSPELCWHNGYEVGASPFIDFKTDVWSLGVTLYHLVFNQFPFQNDNEYRLFHDIVYRDVVIPDIGTFMFNSSFKLYSLFTDFISQCLVKDASRRASISTLMLHPLVSYHMKNSQLEVYRNRNNVLLGRSTQPVAKHKSKWKTKLGNLWKKQSVAESLEESDSDTDSLLSEEEQTLPIEYVPPAEPIVEEVPSRLSSFEPLAAPVMPQSEHGSHRLSQTSSIGKNSVGSTRSSLTRSKPMNNLKANLSSSNVQMQTERRYITASEYLDSLS